jgi:hypothetical protein
MPILQVQQLDDLLYIGLVDRLVFRDCDDVRAA